MKTLLFSLVLLPGPLLAQYDIKMDSASGQYGFQQVFEFQGRSKDSLYAATKLWFANTYKSAKDVIQHEDRDNGIIVAKGLFQISFMMGYPYIRHVIRVDIKDGKVRLTINSFSISDGSSTWPIESYPFGRQKLVRKVSEEVNQIVTSFINGVNNFGVNSDW